MKVCIINCFRDPDYIRAVTLRTALSNIKNVELIVIKNKSKGVRRYFEVLASTIRTRFREHPDVYILTFRGYELLIPIRLLTVGKFMIYDEFINPLELTAIERSYFKKDGYIYKIIRFGYTFWVKRCDLLMTDTASHAELSADISHIDRTKFETVIVSTDEQLFKPLATLPVNTRSSKHTKPLIVFYYTQLQPLHGVEIVLKAAEIVKNENIQFHIVGGKEKLAKKVSVLKQSGVTIHHDTWLSVDKLAQAMRQSDLCLGGPFGKTVQAQRVITGKTYQQLCMAKPTVIGKNLESGIFTDKKDCLLVELGNAMSLSNACRWAADHRDQLYTVGESGRNTYDKHLSNTVLTNQLQQILDKIT